MDTLELRLATEHDLPGILEIERLSYPSPWDAITFASILEDEECWNLTAFYNRRIAGYCFTQVMRNMIHLLNITVHPGLRRMGIARAMLEEMISFARSRNKSYAFLEVRRSNAAAQALYQSMGFTHVCVWRHYYNDSGEDACIMVKRIEGRAS
ncbi:MAG TPA: ribosomal protein S18-alanine N-acetyltransferase [Deltaproteobacteria bacterium]|jgi:ribosomal-protein-alanine N-acetyltransferase|nr:ribosomal protein S18-alanine N-acetyltransferase [Deltaproteobacteria bacterium]HOI06533.1 ribosomal protein S18-alanine N-acetyltransferase [Deltaproteobacteria bacterium]